jgi:hypothetical protein
MRIPRPGRIGPGLCRILDANFRECFSLLKKSIQARLWAHRPALEAPNRPFGGQIEGHKRTLRSFSTGSLLLGTSVNKE